jgi:DNA-binding response OmpR family regulator
MEAAMSAVLDVSDKTTAVCNGRQMADAARRTRPQLKVLFITSYAENAAVGNGHLERGMHVLSKPFAMDQLEARIRPILKGA